MRCLQYSFDNLILAFIVVLPTPLFIAGLEDAPSSKVRIKVLKTVQVASPFGRFLLKIVKGNVHPAQNTNLGQNK